MIDEALQHVHQAQLARLAVHDGQHDHAEVDLKLGVLVEIVEDHLGLLAALQLEHDPHTVAIALIADFGNALDLLFVHQAGRGFNEPGFVDLVRNLGYDDRLAVFAERFRGRFGSQLQCSAAFGEIIQDPLAAEDETRCREIRALHQADHFARVRIRFLYQQNGGVDDLGEIVRRNIGGHAHRDARRSVDQQIRNARRQHLGLHAALVEVGPEVDRFLVEIFKQRRIDAREPRFGVPVGRRRIAVHRSEVALPVDERIAQRKTLRHAHQRVVHRNVAVRVVVSQNLTNDARALSIRAVERQTHLRHGVQNPAMHRLQPVANVGQRAPDDHAHGVIEIRSPHLVFNVDGDDVLFALATQGQLRGVRIFGISQALTP